MSRNMFFRSLLIGLFLVNAVATVASAQEQMVPYRIRSGDTLASIARQFCTTWDDVYYNNQGILGVDPVMLQPNTLIYVTNRCGQSTGGVYDRGPSTYAQGKVVGNVYFTASGDTWYSVGVRFGLPWEQISGFNGGGNLAPGRQVVIPGLSQGQQLPLPPVAVTPGIRIDSPQAFSALPPRFTVSGTGEGIGWRDIVVQALDSQNRVLADARTQLQGANVGSGGSGNWSVTMEVYAAPGTSGRVVVAVPGTAANFGRDVTFGGLAQIFPNANITRFTVDRQQINPGECVTFNWNTQNFRNVYFYREGESWQDNPVDPNPDHTSACPPNSAVHFLRVIGNDGLTEVRTLPIWVGEGQRGGPGPEIPYLGANPSTLSASSRCTTITWSFSGANLRSLSLFRNGQPLGASLAVTAYQDCVPDNQLSGEIIYELRVENQSGGWTTRQMRVTAGRG